MRARIGEGALIGYSRVRIRATLNRGSNKTYKIQFEEWNMNAGNYQIDLAFGQTGVEQEFVVSFDDFIPSWRGYVTGSPGLDGQDKAELSTMGVSLSFVDMDGEYIPGFVSESFELEIHSIELLQ